MTRKITRTLLSTFRKVNSKLYRLVDKCECYRTSLFRFKYAHAKYVQNGSEPECFLQTPADRQSKSQMPCAHRFGSAFVLPESLLRFIKTWIAPSSRCNGLRVFRNTAPNIRVRFVAFTPLAACQGSIGERHALDSQVGRAIAGAAAGAEAPQAHDVHGLEWRCPIRRGDRVRRLFPHPCRCLVLLSV